MPYTWKKNVDVDETIVVMMNMLDKKPELPDWLVTTISGAKRDSDPALVTYFYEEVKKFAPASITYFTEGSTRAPT